ncbi:hypothetical protein BOTBODRAFT_185652 [Botryobasidium botryosum FD-172 SS1]|uniref:Uncharacterized protein n=1 Tax=Botryobasidium botryosum (strain FD-172 SS1) TaxID=930990 RepID=A0A067N128_BOTB1|nr:hypothetical protein BOTBODRAFT_185652 [Botryobasidium botryosum FD-172 SS1]
MFSAPRCTALAIFASYFFLIIFLFTLILRSVYTRFRAFEGHKTRPIAFLGLALCSFAQTWYWMFRFLIWSFRSYESLAETTASAPLFRLTDWLMHTELFEQAWATVCLGDLNWWWSEQLCLYTAGALTVFFYIEGRRWDIPHTWAYMLLGQVVAISVASSLFFLALSLSPAPSTTSRKGVTRVSLTLYLPLLLSFATIFATPYTVGTPNFLPNLLAMHALLVIPLIPLDHIMLLPMRVSTLYGVLTALSLVFRLRTTLPLISFPSHFVRDAWVVLQDTHPAQSSIGWDVVWSTIAFLVWVRGGWKEMGAALGLSVGVCAPAVWRSLEEERIEAKAGKEA